MYTTHSNRSHKLTFAKTAVQFSVLSPTDNCPEREDGSVDRVRLFDFCNGQGLLTQSGSRSIESSTSSSSLSPNAQSSSSTSIVSVDFFDFCEKSHCSYYHKQKSSIWQHRVKYDEHELELYLRFFLWFGWRRIICKEIRQLFQLLKTRKNVAGMNILLHLK